MSEAQWRTAYVNPNANWHADLAQKYFEACDVHHAWVAEVNREKSSFWVGYEWSARVGLWFWAD